MKGWTSQRANDTKMTHSAERRLREVIILVYKGSHLLRFRLYSMGILLSIAMSERGKKDKKQYDRLSECV